MNYITRHGKRNALGKLMISFVETEYKMITKFGPEKICAKHSKTTKSLDSNMKKSQNFIFGCFLFSPSTPFIFMSTFHAALNMNVFQYCILQLQYFVSHVSDYNAFESTSSLPHLIEITVTNIE